MKWHCGLLSERPDKDPVLNWVQRGYWVQGLPPEIDRELMIWLAMPGLSISFHSHTLGVSKPVIAHNIGGYDEWRDQVAENWLSATREDCVRLAQIRPPMGDLPLLSQFQIMSDLKAGMRQVDLARLYKTNVTKVQELGRGHIRMRQPLPPGFELMVQTHQP